jgi:2-dehydro-3-deoxyphosphogluconate aldolase / (4S)-4-hydroxy-2-oxoglutarate aldolase
MYPWQTLARLAEEQVVAIIRAPSAEAARATAHQILDTGLGVIEVSLTTPGGLEVIADLRRDYPDVIVGAGTVLDEPTARLAVLAGAQLLISPILVDEVVLTARRYGVIALPGCSSPTEMMRALQLGAGAVKVFPASAWTPQDLHGVRQALPQLPLVPTGGVTVESAPAWIAAGAIAVGMGSGLTRGGPVEAQRRVGDLRAALKAVR